MKRISGYLYLTGAFAFAGTVVITARQLSGRIGVFTISAAALAIALCAMLPFRIGSIIKTLKNYGTKDWAYMAFQAASGIFLYRTFMLFGIQHTSALEAGLLTGATPAITVALARIVLKERIKPLKLAGIACTCGGIAALQADFNAASSFSWEHMLGNALVLCSAACESCFNVFSRKDSVRGAGHINPIDRTACVAAIAFVLCAVPALFESPVERLQALGLSGWLALVWYGLGATAIAYVLFYAGVKRCDAGTTAAFSGMIPFTAFWLSVLVLGERAGFVHGLGALLVISGILMISRVKRPFSAKGQLREMAKADD